MASTATRPRRRRDMFPGRKRGRRDPVARGRAADLAASGRSRERKRVGERTDGPRSRPAQTLTKTTIVVDTESFPLSSAHRPARPSRHGVDEPPEACGRCRARARGARPPSPARRATKRTRTRSRKRRRRCRRRRRRGCLVVFVGRRRHHRRDRHAGRAAGGWRRHHSPVRPERRRGDARGVPPRGQGGARRAAERRPDGVAHGAVRRRARSAGRQSHRRSAGAPHARAQELHDGGRRRDPRARRLGVRAEGAVAAAEERGRNVRTHGRRRSRSGRRRKRRRRTRRGARRGTSRVRSEDRRVVRSRAPRSSRRVHAARVPERPSGFNASRGCARLGVGANGRRRGTARCRRCAAASPARCGARAGKPSSS